MPLPNNYLISLILHDFILATSCYVTRWCVQQYHVRVNYTRKINHFMLMLVPFVLAWWFPYEPSIVTTIMSLIVFVMLTAIFLPPIRDRIPKCYTRSYEGSACVWLTSMVVILGLMPILSWSLFIGLMILVPPIMTLTEALSPHFWDAPLMYAIGGAMVSLVLVIAGG